MHEKTKQWKGFKGLTNYGLFTKVNQQNVLEINTFVFVY